MARTMIDSVSPASVHEAAADGIVFDIVAGYADAGYGPSNPNGWTAEAWGQFPGKELVRIAALKGTLGADAYDVERGDLTPPDAPVVSRRERATGRNPAMYSDDSTWPEIVTAYEQAGEALPPRWNAEPNGTPHLTAGAVATQYEWRTSPNVDLSLVAEGWPHPVAPPKPPPPPVITPTGDPTVPREITLTINVGPDPDGTGSAGWAVIGEFVDHVVSVEIGGQDPATSGKYVDFDAPTAEAVGVGLTKIQIVSRDTFTGPVTVRVFCTS